jgi:hypothetical protein
VWPNPATTHVQISLSSLTSSSISVKLLNQQVQVVRQQQYNGNASNLFHFELNGGASGIHTLVIYDKDTVLEVLPLYIK